MAKRVIGSELTVDLLPGVYHRRPNINLKLFYQFSNIVQNSASSSQRANFSYQSVRLPASAKLYLSHGHQGFFLQPGIVNSFNFTSGINYPSVTLKKWYLMGLIGAGYTRVLNNGQSISASAIIERSIHLPYDIVYRQLAIQRYQAERSLMLSFSF